MFSNCLILNWSWCWC